MARNEKRVIRVGSRESRLAVAQAELVMDRIQACHPELTLELVTMKTTGDKILDRSLEAIGGKGLFVKELDRALRDGTIDISVHSLKDMPMEEDPELPLLAFSVREDPRDALVLPCRILPACPGPEDGPYCAPETEDQDGLRGPLRFEKPLGCSSARRRLQLDSLFPGVQVEGIRGNVITRLAKLDAGVFGGLVLASAGLRRLGLAGRISRCFSVEEMLPAAGQGILAVQGRAGEDHAYLDCVDDAASRAAALAERRFVKTLDGGCTSPVAAFARVRGKELSLTGFYVNPQTGQQRKGALAGMVSEAEILGEQLAGLLRDGKEQRL